MILRYQIFGAMNIPSLLYQINNQQKIMLGFIALISLLVLPLQATIAISSPLVTPFSDNLLPYFYANFGVIRYDKSQTYDLFITNQSLCKNHNFSLTVPTFIVTVEDFSTNCSDTRQALLAQYIGASGVIISSEYTRYTQGQIVLADDGNGRRVNIPSLFISNQTYAQLSQISTKIIQITVNFPLPKAQQSTLTFFISASQRAAYLFLGRLLEDYLQFNNTISINAVYYTYESQWAGEENCYGEIYCSYDYDNFEEGVGQAIIREQLHQYAILQQDGALAWLQYMANFDDICDYNWYDVNTCNHKVHQTTGIPNRGVGRDPIGTLQQWKTQEKQYGFETIPEVAINGMIFRGSLNYASFMQAVCQSISTPPVYCLGANEEGKPAQSTGNKTALKAMTLVLLTLALIGVGSFWVYRKCIKQEATAEMTGRVNELVANYASTVARKTNRKHEILQEEL